MNELAIKLTIDDEYISYGKGANAFDLPNWLNSKAVSLRIKAFSGVVTINSVEVKFSYSPFFNDGDIMSNNSLHRYLVKQLCSFHTYNLVLLKEDTMN